MQCYPHNAESDVVNVRSPEIKWLLSKACLWTTSIGFQLQILEFPFFFKSRFTSRWPFSFLLFFSIFTFTLWDLRSLPHGFSLLYWFDFYQGRKKLAHFCELQRHFPSAHHRFHFKRTFATQPTKLRLLDRTAKLQVTLREASECDLQFGNSMNVRGKKTWAKKRENRKKVWVLTQGRRRNF